jgi:prephenate dehydratase
VTAYGYLGPEGTFSEAALLASLGATDGLPEGVRLTPYAGVAAAIAGVRAGEVVASMVPVENSVEGAVAQTLDLLATGAPLTVIGEAVLPVAFSLLARPGTTLADLKRVGTHPHAEAQTRQWFAAHLPGVAVVPTTSTAAAAAALADGTAHWDGDVSAPIAASLYGLAVHAEGVGDNAAAETRFVLVSGPAAPPAASGADKTSLVLYIGQDHPGALMEILTEFAVRGINLTRIESRPTGGGIGDYFFSIDCEGHVDDARVGEALMGLRRVCAEVRFLGSFPRVDGVRPALRRGVSDAEYHDAQAWLARVREGRA